MDLALGFRKGQCWAHCFILSIHPLWLTLPLNTILIFTFTPRTHNFMLSSRPQLSPIELLEREASLLACVAGEMDLWMVCKKLKRNRDNSELTVFSSQFRPTCRPPLTSLTIGDEVVNSSTKVRNNRAFLDEHLSRVPQVSQICKSSFFHLRYIARIHNYLTPPSHQIGHLRLYNLKA